MKPHFRSARAILTISILGGLFYVIGWKALIEALADTQWRWIALMYCASMIGLFANAALSRGLLRQAGLHVTVQRVVLANTLSTFYTLFVPSDILAGIAKWADLSAATGDKPRVFSALVLAKVWLALPPLVLGTLALAIYSPFASSTLAWTTGSMLSVSLIMMGLLLHSHLGPRTDRVLAQLMRRLPHFFQTKLLAVVNSFASFRGRSPTGHFTTAVFSLAAFAAGIFGFACAAIATGADAPISALLWLSMTLFITRLVPITFSNLGVRETILALGLGLYGVPSAVAVTVGIIMFSNTILVALIGGTYQLALLRGWLTWKDVGIVERTRVQ